MPNKKLTNKEKAIALLQTFETGKTELIADYIREDYIQHNLDFSTGREAILAAIKGLSQATPKPHAEVVRAFEDGNYVVLHMHYSNFAGSNLAALDVFRFHEGKIAEHWDSLMPVQKPNPSGRTQFDGSKEIVDLDKTEANKKLVREFQEKLIKGDFASASKLLDPKYKQHNPQVGDGVEAVAAVMAESAKKGLQLKFNKLHHVLGQGNFVFMSTEGAIGSQTVAIFDLFRVDNGKIVEHWDVISPYDEKKRPKGVNNPFHKF